MPALEAGTITAALGPGYALPMRASGPYREPAIPDDGLDRLVARMREARRQRRFAWLASITAMSVFTVLTVPVTSAAVLGAWEMTQWRVTGILFAPWIGLALAMIPGAWVGAQVLGALLPKRDEDDIAHDG